MLGVPDGEKSTQSRFVSSNVRNLDMSSMKDSPGCGVWPSQGEGVRVSQLR